MRILTACLLLVSYAVAQESYTLSGSVRDASTGELLAAANIRELGTSRGTVANADGKFRLQLAAGTRTIVASSIGYKPDTVVITMREDTHHNFSLAPAAIVFPEIVVSGEDPALEIIRRAITNKKMWREKLHSYTMEAFTRQVLKRDGEIASITESFTDGYWQQGDTLREIVKQKRQTENVKAEFNFASVGRLLNFNDDEIKFIGYTFVGPTADDAFDYYDYKLLRTRAGQGKEIHEIAMIPLTRTRPLFTGTISIAGDSYALMGVDVEPNEAFSVPFVSTRQLRYRQQFGLYDHTFWMPADIRIDADVEIRVPLIQIPSIAFSQSSVITDYAINTTIPDTIFRKPRLTVDTLAAATLDSAFWRENNVLPLTLEEENAYATLDSTQTLDVQFRPRGVAFHLGADDGGAASAVEFADAAFNRVEGFRLGARLTLDSLSKLFALRVAVAYGFSDKKGKFSFGATVFTTSKREAGFGFDLYRRLDYRPDQGYYSPLFNSFTSLFAKNDYRDYFEAQGGRLFAAFRPAPTFRLDIMFAVERHRSVQQHSDFSIFSRSRSYRPNPVVREFATLQSLRLDWRFGPERAPFDFVSRNSLEVSMEWGAQDLLRGNSSFGRIHGVASFAAPTLGRSHLFPAMLRGRISGGIATENVPPQRLFDLESASSGFAQLGVFRAMDVKEFSGTRFVAVNLEHNFRSLPFLALGIPFLYRNNIEFVMHGGIARTWAQVHRFTTDTVRLYYYPENPTHTLYAELGFGFSRIFDLLRVDFTWRLSAPYNFRFTLGVANLL